MGKAHHIALNSTLTVKSEVNIGIRNYMSSGMLRTAKRFAAEAQKIETKHVGVWKSPHVEQHMDYAIASIVSSALFMEAMINELYTDASEKHGIDKEGYIAPLDKRTQELMAGWWEETNKGFDKTLTKYQLLLTFAGKSKLNTSAEPYQSALLLIQLRNTIVHFRPETIYSNQVHELEKKLKGKFEDNKLAHPKSNWWTSRAIGAGCAEWAADSAQAFADEVSKRLNIKPNYMRQNL
jgi:hypothetical protein